jgi:hypothetical protein
MISPARPKSQLPVVGITELVQVGNYPDVPAKIDTGADRSAIWASKIRVSPDGVLSFALFGPSSPHYTGRLLRRTDFGVAKVKSSNGTMQIRYRTHLTVAVAGRRIRALFYLSDRSTQQFPILIGRRTIRGKFAVDVSRTAVKLQRPRQVGHNAALRRDPYAFHQQYYGGSDRHA